MALDFYYKSIRGICQTTEEAFKALEKQFNSFQHQAQGRTYLKNLSIETVMKEKDCSAMVVLETIHSRITETTPNCGLEYQHTVHYCDFLEGAVIGQPWAEAVIQERLTPSPDQRFEYNTFYSKLCAALTSYEASHGHDRNSHQPDSIGAAPFFGERYANRPPRGKKSTRRGSSATVGPNLNVTSMLRPPNRIKRQMSSSQLAQLKVRTRCLRCQQIGHWRHECSNRATTAIKDVMLSHVAQLGNDETAVAKALWAMVEDDEEYYAFLEFSNKDYCGDAQPSMSLSTPALSNSFETLLTDLPESDAYTEAMLKPI